MTSAQDTTDAVRLLKDGWSDESVERLTGLGMMDIVELRALAAAGPARRRTQAAAENPAPTSARAPS